VVTAVALAFAGATLAVLGAGLLLEGGWRRRRRSRPGGERRPGGVPAGLRLLARAGGAATRRVAPRDLERRIAAAGRPGGLEPSELMAAKLVASLLAAVPGMALGVVAPGRLGPVLAVAVPVAGFLGPDLWLARQAARRAATAARDLPELLELLRVTVDAGASPAAALGAVGARAAGPLAAEWRAVAAEAALGVPLAQALAGMGERLPTPEVRALVGALERTRRHGVPLGATLAAQARDARLALRRRVQEDAARAGPKIQLVVALLLVPSVLLLVAAALVSALAGSGAASFR
jgi:tight adherence protein C